MEFEQWFILFVLASGFFNLARKLQLSLFSALVAASCALAMPFVFIWIHHPIALALCWLPWLFIGIHQAKIINDCIVTALIFLSGHHGTILHVLALGLALFITRPSSKVLLGFIFGLGLSALLWLPQLAFIIESESLWSRGSNQLHFRTLIDIFWPQIFGHPSSDNYTGLDEWASSQPLDSHVCTLWC